MYYTHGWTQYQRFIVPLLMERAEKLIRQDWLFCASCSSLIERQLDIGIDSLLSAILYIIVTSS